MQYRQGTHCAWPISRSPMPYVQYHSGCGHVRFEDIHAIVTVLDPYRFGFEGDDAECYSGTRA